MFFNCSLYFVDKGYNNLFVQVSANISNSLNITAKEFKVNLLLHFL